MPRRVNLPGASELFRPTEAQRRAAEKAASPVPAPNASPVPAPSTEPARGTSGPQASGRVRHDEKITVYVSSAELLALEQARIALRADHRLAVDRGRIVRAAIAGALADLEARGGDSELVHRLGDT